jgi:hypothetical protein
VSDSTAAAAVGEAVGHCLLDELDDDEFVKGYTVHALIVSIHGGERVWSARAGVGRIEAKGILEEAVRQAEAGEG